MRRLHSICLFIIACLTPVIGRADGALVVASHQSGSVWLVLGSGYADAATARAEGLKFCRNTPGTISCRAAITFRDSCYAYATASGGGWGGDAGSDHNTARANALASCYRHNPGQACHVHDSKCDTVGIDQQRQREAEEATARQIEIERQQREEREAWQQAFETWRTACGHHVVDACDAGLSSPHASSWDKIDLKERRSRAVAFNQAFEACKAGSVGDCDVALQAPGTRADQTDQLSRWRQAAIDARRPATPAAVPVTAAPVSVATTASSISPRLDSSIAVGIGVLCVIFALVVLHLRAGNIAGTEAAAAGPSPISAALASARKTIESALKKTTDVAPVSPEATAAAPPSQPPPEPPRERDTPAAIAALELAHAYIEEVREAERPGVEDKDMRKDQLNTLSLAAKQLDLAEQNDPDAVLEGQDAKDIPYRYTVNELKAEALLLEGLTHQMFDLRRAIPALQKATALNPNQAQAFYVLGLTHASNMNKAEAIVAYECAVALDPKNIVYRKELNRAQNMSVSEIAAFKATRAGERIFDAGIKTANSGIFVYNIGVYAWNVFAFCWNVVTFPLRLLLKTFGVLDRLLGVR